jgi:signal recognition particle subunit SRP54
MIVGLQGSGKTTSTGKIARWLSQNQQRKPLLLSTDVYRPAAREQLKVIAKATNQSIFEKPETNDPLELTRSALQHARDTGYDTLLIDTAGRLAHRRSVDGRAGQHQEPNSPRSKFFLLRMR